MLRVCRLFITSNEGLSLTTTKTDPLTALKYDNAYLRPSLALTEQVGRRNEFATIFHNVIKKLPIFSKDIQFLTVSAKFPRFRRTEGPALRLVCPS
jgi:hypothetical protein